MLISGNCLAEGKIVIQPKIQSGIEAHSNYWKAEDQEVSVNTYFTKPGLVFGYETAKTEIAVDATADAYWYDDQDTPPPGVRDASDDNYVGVTGEARINHQLTDRLNVGMSDQIYVTRDPARADGNSNSVSRDKYTINYLEPNAYYEFADKFGIKAKYRNTVTDYEKDLEDSTEHRGVFDLYYNLNRSSAVYVDYQVWERTYDQTSSDYLSNQVSLNYETKFNYFSIKGGAGYHNRSFDDDTLDDLDLFTWKIQLKGQDPDSTLKTTKSRLALDVGQEMNDDGTGDNYFTATFLRFEGGYRLFNRLEGSVKAAYQNSDYKTDNRDEDTYLASARLAYQALDFLALGVEGGYETRDSNVNGNSYDDTFVLLTLDIDYDFGSKK
jgi:hypothetical protein